MSKERVRILLTFMVTFGITMLCCVGYISKLSNDYETQLAFKDQSLEQFYAAYDQKIEEMQELRYDYEDLQTEVYKIINGEDYEVTIQHRGKTYTYRTEGTGFFRNVIEEVK